MLREIVLVPAMLSGLMQLSGTESQAQEFCAEREVMVQSLSDQYREAPAAIGQVSGIAVVEVFVSKEGTWTILATGTDGQSCVISAGEGWELNLAALSDGA